MGSAKSHLSARSKTVEWLTPSWLMRGLGEFDLDPCAATNSRMWYTARGSIALPNDGLQAKWHGRVWLNPPYGPPKIIRPWIRKLREHGDGIALIPAATETNMWHEDVWPFAAGILFIKQRPHFCTPDGKASKNNSGYPVALIAYGTRNAERLRNSGTEGFYVSLAAGEHPASQASVPSSENAETPTDPRRATP